MYACLDQRIRQQSVQQRVAASIDGPLQLNNIAVLVPKVAACIDSGRTGCIVSAADVFQWFNAFWLFDSRDSRLLQKPASSTIRTSRRSDAILRSSPAQLAQVGIVGQVIRKAGNSPPTVFGG